MKKGHILIVVLLVSVVFLCGCSTAKGVATGVGTTVVATTEGAAKDIKGACNGIKKADNWIKKNLW